MISFHHEKINDHLYRIIDHFDVCMYLAVGENKACLMDTGYGIAGLRSYIETITDLPVFVLLSHGHIDHASGCNEFDEVYLNQDDFSIYDLHMSEKFRNHFMPYLKDYDQFDYQQKKEHIIPLKDKDEFDLDGLHIRAYQVPGHTRGMTMFLLEEQRIMIFGDGCGPGTILLEDCSTDIETYFQSLLKIKKIESAYDTVLRNHGTYHSPKVLLDNVIEVCKEILEGKDDRIELSEQEKTMMSIPQHMKAFQAKKTIMTDNGLMRVDKKEGNVSYREDKV